MGGRRLNHAGRALRSERPAVAPWIHKSKRKEKTEMYSSIMPRVYLDCVVGRVTRVHYLRLDETETRTFQKVGDLIEALLDAGHQAAVLQTEQAEYIIDIAPVLDQTEETNG